MTKGEKISQSLKRHFADSPSPLKGRTECFTMSEDARRRISQFQKGRKKIRKKPPLPDHIKRARNKEKVYAYRARLYDAIPEGVDRKLIKQIYEMCPDGYHVDHRISLSKGGLHCPTNLQYLPVSENCRKGNRDTQYDVTLAIQWDSLISTFV